MSRKLVAGFRTLLDDVCVAWSDAGASTYANEWGGDKDSERAHQAAEREAHRAKRKLERMMLAVLIRAHCATSAVRAGWSQPGDLETLASSLAALADNARMEGRRFTAGHSEATRRRYERRAA